MSVKAAESSQFQEQLSSVSTIPLYETIVNQSSSAAVELPAVLENSWIDEICIPESLVGRNLTNSSIGKNRFVKMSREKAIEYVSGFIAETEDVNLPAEILNLIAEYVPSTSNPEDRVCLISSAGSFSDHLVVIPTADKNNNRLLEGICVFAGGCPIRIRSNDNYLDFI
jgi:hypothetical protein